MQCFAFLCSVALIFPLIAEGYWCANRKTICLLLLFTGQRFTVWMVADKVGVNMVLARLELTDFIIYLFPCMIHGGMEFVSNFMQAQKGYIRTTIPKRCWRPRTNKAVLGIPFGSFFLRSRLISTDGGKGNQGILWTKKIPSSSLLPLERNPLI